MCRKSAGEDDFCIGWIDPHRPNAEDVRAMMADVPALWEAMAQRNLGALVALLNDRFPMR